MFIKGIWACSLAIVALTLGTIALSVLHGRGMSVLTETALGEYGPTLLIFAFILFCTAAAGLLWAHHHQMAFKADRIVVFLGYFGLLLGAASVPVLAFIDGDLRKSVLVEIADNRLYWCDSVRVGSTELVDERIAAYGGDPRQLTLVLMNNGGGSVAESERLVRRLSELGVSRVEAVGHCASACTSVWLQMPERYLARDSALGFHGAFSMTREPDKKVTATIFGHLVAAGIEKADAKRLMGYPPHDLGWLTATSPELSGVSFNRVERHHADGLACPSKRG